MLHTMKNVQLFSIVTVFIILAVVKGSKILLVPVQMKSHVLEQLVVGEELARRGHQVHVVVALRFPNLNRIEKRHGVKPISFQMPDDALASFSDEFERQVAKNIFEVKDKFREVNEHAEFANRDCALMMEDKKFIQQVRNENFDLAISDGFMVALCSIILPRNLSIPYVVMTNTFSPWVIRLQSYPSVSPTMGFWQLPKRMSFTERISNLMTYLLFLNMDKIMPATNNVTLLYDYCSTCGSWQDLLFGSELFLWTLDHHLDYMFPVVPSIVLVAGLTAIPAKPLPDELEKRLNNSKDGVILLTFGSIVNSLPKVIIEQLLLAFDGLKKTVLVKFIVPDGVSVPSNVVLQSWLPQNDILGHANVKLFITHCGNNGQHEALYHRVPMLGFPLFAEQDHNCRRMVSKGFGLELSIHDFTSDELRSTIEELINNKTYATNIRRASEIWRDEPMDPRAKAVYWIEHILKYGGRHLRSVALDMPMYQFLMLDVLALFVVVLFIAVFILKTVVCYILHKLSSTKINKLKPE